MPESVLGLPQQVGEGQRFEGAGAGGSGIPERVGVPGVPPATHRAQRARAARRVDAIDADHRAEVKGRSLTELDNKEKTAEIFKNRKILGELMLDVEKFQDSVNVFSPPGDASRGGL